MMPWEVEAGGRIYIHEDNWIRQRHSWLVEQYPCPQGKWRIDITLESPRTRLADVPVINLNPHSHFGFPPHRCYYVSDRWSTIFGVHNGRGRYTNTCHRMIVESDNPEPIWGERVILLSTSSAFINEPWGRNVANKFAYFRGQFWQIAKFDFLHSYESIRGFGNALWTRQGQHYNANMHVAQEVLNCWGEERMDNIYNWHDIMGFNPPELGIVRVYPSRLNPDYNGNRSIYRHGL